MLLSRSDSCKCGGDTTWWSNYSKPYYPVVWRHASEGWTHYNTITQMEAVDIEAELKELTNSDQNGLLNDEARTFSLDNDQRTIGALTNPLGAWTVRRTWTSLNQKKWKRRKATKFIPKHQCLKECRLCLCRRAVCFACYFVTKLFWSVISYLAGILSQYDGFLLWNQEKTSRSSWAFSQLFTSAAWDYILKRCFKPNWTEIKNRNYSPNVFFRKNPTHVLKIQCNSLSWC